MLNISFFKNLSRVCMFIVGVGSIGGCSVIQNELNYPAGNVGVLEDKYLIKANTRRMDLYRALVVTAAFTRIAERRVQGSEASSTINDINGILGTVDRLFELAESPCGLTGMQGNLKEDPAADSSCPNNAYPAAYEPKIPDLQNFMFRLAVDALSTSAIKALVEDTKNGDYLSAAFDFLTTAGQLTEDLRYVGAVGRGDSELRLATLFGYFIKTGRPSDAAVIANSFSERDARDAALIMSQFSKDMSDAPLRPTKNQMLAMHSVIMESCLRLVRIAPNSTSQNLRCHPFEASWTEGKFLGVPITIDGLNDLK